MLFFAQVENFTGLEGFISLRRLSLRELSANTIDISGFSNLENLRLEATLIESLTISNNPKLINISTEDSNLGNVNIIDNSKLESVYTEDSSASFFKTSQNSNLKDVITVDGVFTNTFEVSDNLNLETVQLITPKGGPLNINLSDNQNLKIVGLDNVSLASITLSNSDQIERLDLSDSNFSSPSTIKSIDISNQNNLQRFSALDNPLTCIKVNQSQLDNIPVSWEIDSEDTYALDCPE